METKQKQSPIARHNTLAAAIVDVLSYPGKASSAMLVYVHDEASVQACSNVLSKEDAKLLLPQIETWQAMLKSIIEKGRL